MRGARLLATGMSRGVAIQLLALTATAGLLAWAASAGGRGGGVVIEQVGEEFLDPTAQESAPDLSARIQRVLRAEALLLNKIAARTEKRQHVDIDVTAGQIGVVGPQGPKGYTGVRGYTGPRGATGPRGETGPRGKEGPPGIQGVKGADGMQGASGAPGRQGARGPAGPRGRG